MANLVRPKLTVFFQQGIHGWSENWYLPTNLFTYQTALTLGQQYVAQRVTMLGAGASITYLRVSDDTVKNDSMVKVITSKDGASTAPNSGDYVAEDANTALVVRCEGGPLHRRSWEVHGLLDSAISTLFPLGFNPGDPSITALTKVGQWLVNNQFCFKVKTAPNTYVAQPITSVQPVRVGSRKTGRPFGVSVGRLP
jgi:hypothetical protein